MESQTSKVVQHLRRAALLQDGAGLTDGQLLGRFLEHRDEVAFATLVRRHGPMVWGACRRLLEHHDAEDAFQAAFLVLFRKAASIRPRERVATWLHGVAHRAALQARRAAARRSARERQVAPMPDPEAAQEGPWRDLQPLLDQELSRLPDNYRLVLILCDLEGKTRKEAAQQLGAPEGTVAGRLARARTMLAKRLARHGLGASGGAVAALWSQDVTAAEVPAWVVSSTVNAASRLGAGQAGVTSAKVAALTEGVLRSMSLTKLKIATAVVLAVLAVVAAGAGGLLYRAPAGEPPQPPKAEKPAAPKGGKPAPVVVREDGFIAQVVYTPDGKVLATVGRTYDLIDDFEGSREVRNCTVKLRDARTGELRRSLGEEKHTTLRALTFSPDRKTAALAAAKPDEPGNWEVRLVGARTWALKRRVKSDGSVLAVAFSPDGKRLAFGGGNSRLTEDGSFVTLWDVPNAKRLGGTKERKPGAEAAPEEGKGKRGHVTCLAFSPDGKLLAAGDFDGKVRLLDGQTGDPKRVLEGHREMVTGVAFSPDGKALVSGSYDGTAKLWDVPKGKIRQELEGTKGYVMAVAFSPDGRHLATGEQGKDDKRVTLWDARTGKRKHTLAGLKMSVVTLAFSPDGKTLAFAGGTKDFDPNTGSKTTGRITLLPLGPLMAKRK
jgi:RNA polymerase sigma factor (sigma-70 family)